MRRAKVIVMLSLLAVSSASYANWFADIIRVIQQTSAITNGQLSNINASQSEMLNSQQNIEELMRQVNNNMQGHSGWGTYQYHDYQTYGAGSSNWSDVMSMAQSGGGSGALGEVLRDVAKQMPYDNRVFNQGVTDSNIQNYYALKSQTVLAARAASQLDYNKIQDQIAYQQMLEQQIEKTRDLKGAMDLSNRIQIESNLIALQILRQSALANQQQAVSEQAGVVSAFSNAKFLTK